MSTASISASEAAEGGRGPVGAIVVVSGVAVAFLLWLLYVHQAPPSYAEKLRFLPALNALLNGSSAVALVIGYVLVRRREITAHRNAMITAFVFSSIFLLSYITHHALHGDTRYPGQGVLRTVYLAVLGSHVLLSVVALPLVLTTFFFSLAGRFPQHRRVARYTFPVWLYVSVTGVLVYVLLASA